MLAEGELFYFLTYLFEKIFVLCRFGAIKKIQGENWAFISPLNH